MSDRLRGSISEYYVDRCCPPYRFPHSATDKLTPNEPPRFAEIYRNWKLIGVQTERRNSCIRNWRCWTLRLLRVLRRHA